MPATYEPIATQTVAVAASSVTFSSIPSTYTDLRIVIVPTALTSDNFAFRFNSDSGTNYSQTRLAANGSTVTSSRTTSQTELQLTSSFNIGTTPTMRTLDVFSYTGSTFKTMFIEETADTNGAGGLNKRVGLYRSTSAINSINFFAQGVASFAIGSTFTLYGIKNA
jgi:hypothetical protein